MQTSKLIGKTVEITNRESWVCGSWGRIVAFDGELYHVEMFDGDGSALVFERNEFKVPRKQ